MGWWGDLKDWAGEQWDEAVQTGEDAFGADPLGEQRAAEEQIAAQERALSQQMEEAQRARDFFTQQSDKAIDFLAQGQQRSAGALGRQFGEADRRAAEAQAGVEDALSGGRSGALGALTTAEQGAESDLRRGFGQARTDLNPLLGLQEHAAGATQSVGTADVVGQRGGRLADMLDQPGGLYGNFQADPGYQFRQQQGEEAINRAAAARGGRLSGRTLQDLSQFNQGLASQEFGNFAQRQNALAGMAGAEDQSLNALLQGQAGRQLSADLAAQGNQMGLAGMGFGAQGQLSNLAAQRAGALANLGASMGTQRAGIEERGGQALGDTRTQFGMASAQSSQDLGRMLADVFQQTATGQANASIGAGTNNTGISQGMMGAYQNFANTGGMATQAGANSKKEMLGALLAAFSDARLKTAVRTVKGSIFERLGLRGVRWTWNDQANALGLWGDGEGVLAQDVLRKYPEAVERLPSGWLGVRYGLLLSMVEG